jgi:hypothetical protein
MDMVYEYSENEHDCESPMPLFYQIQIWFHTLLCPNCAHEIERFEITKDVMRHDFFPASPSFEESVMTRIAAEEIQTESYVSPGGFSTRSWVITGLIILVSLATVFFGLDFQKIAYETGMSFLLPVGITIGIVLTVYGAFFIGSHLKELTERFGL